jgi:phosphotransacetylase
MSLRIHLQKLVERTRRLPPLAAALVYPCDEPALELALAGEFAGYLSPLLVGPGARIRDTALRSGLDVSRLPIVDTPDDPTAAATCAVDLAREGRVAALVKGAMSDGALLTPVAQASAGLRTDRRLSHATWVEWPSRDRPLVVADDRLAVAPSLAAKRDILLNTVEFAQALGIAVPAVAIVAARDTPSQALASTVDAVSLRMIAAQSLGPGATVDGPMTVDVALSADAARALRPGSPVAGVADVVLAPSMESASMIVRTLVGANGAFAAGLVLGARVPIVVAGPGDSIESRVASCVLAALVAAQSRARDATVVEAARAA